MNFTFEQTEHEPVTFDRGYGPEKGMTTHKLFLPIVKDMKEVGRGAFLGLGVRTEKGFDLYCQMEQLR